MRRKQKSSTTITVILFRLLWLRQGLPLKNRPSQPQWTLPKFDNLTTGRISIVSSRLRSAYRNTGIRIRTFVILDDNSTSNVLKFVDDTKLSRKVKNYGDKQHLQNDLDKLVKWSENGRCYYILGNVNAYTQDRGTWV